MCVGQKWESPWIASFRCALLHMLPVGVVVGVGVGVGVGEARWKFFEWTGEEAPLWWQRLRQFAFPAFFSLLCTRQENLTVRPWWRSLLREELVWFIFVEKTKTHRILPLSPSFSAPSKTYQVTLWFIFCTHFKVTWYSALQRRLAPWVLTISSMWMWNTETTCPGTIGQWCLCSVATDLTLKKRF